MFKVICIIKPNTNTAFPGTQWPPVEVGDTFTVAEVEEYQGRTWYAFIGIDDHFVYDAELFARISDITDEEIEEEYQEQEAADLDRQFAKIVHEYENA
jgi:hypothetical protein